MKLTTFKSLLLLMVCWNAGNSLVEAEEEEHTLNLQTVPKHKTYSNKRYVVVGKDDLVTFTVSTTPDVYSFTWDFENGDPGTWSRKPGQMVAMIYYRSAAEGKTNVVSFTSKRTEVQEDESEIDCVLEDHRTCAVIVPKFITPAGNPVSSPNNGTGAYGTTSQDGQNEFTFSATSTGTLQIDFKVEIQSTSHSEGGPPLSNMAGDFTFEVDDIGSPPTWASGNEGGKGKKDPNGNYLIASATYNGLPANNSDFGKKKVKLKYDNGVNVRVVAEADFEVFFPTTSDSGATFTVSNHPGGGGSPNWFYYWGQVSGISNLNWAGTHASLAGEVRGMTLWSYAASQSKTNIYIYSPAGPASGSQYNVGELFTGIDWTIGIMIHENRHVWQIAQADTLVSGGANTPWRFGWAWNQNTSGGSPNHNHWTVGADGEPGVAGVDDDGDGTVDNLINTGRGELGHGDDVNLTHSSDTFYQTWPHNLTPPSPLSLPPSYMESDAINYTNSQLNDNDNAPNDWADPGKNHQTVNQWND